MSLQRFILYCTELSSQTSSSSKFSSFTCIASVIFLFFSANLFCVSFLFLWVNNQNNSEQCLYHLKRLLLLHHFQCQMNFLYLNFLSILSYYILAYWLQNLNHQHQVSLAVRRNYLLLTYYMWQNHILFVKRSKYLIWIM